MESPVTCPSRYTNCIKPTWETILSSFFLWATADASGFFFMYYIPANNTHIWPWGSIVVEPAMKRRRNTGSHREWITWKSGCSSRPRLNEKIIAGRAEKHLFKRIFSFCSLAPLFLPETVSNHSFRSLHVESFFRLFIWSHLNLYD